MSVLEQIAAQKRDEVARSRRRLPADRLAERVVHAPPPRDFAAALKGGATPRVIAEVKRASPSKGMLRAADHPLPWDPVALASAYERAGARCLSVLTNVPYFWGQADDLVACRDAVGLPVLRKDFIVDAYQIDESRWLGADAVLLIAALLDGAQLSALAAQALGRGMAVLVEVHDAAEVERALGAGDDARILIGINHRDLKTLEIDLRRSAELRPMIPAGRTVVAESGISDRASMEPILAAGIHQFLIGGHLAASPDPENALRALLGTTS